MREDTEKRRHFELEALLSEYEGKAKPVIDKLVAAAPGLSANERNDLSIKSPATGTPRTVQPPLAAAPITRPERLLRASQRLYACPQPPTATAALLTSSLPPPKAAMGPKQQQVGKS